MPNENQVLLPPLEHPSSFASLIKRGIHCYSNAAIFCSSQYLLPAVFAAFWNLGLSIFWQHAAAASYYHSSTFLPVLSMLLADLALFFFLMWTTASRLYALKRMSLNPGLTLKNAQSNNFGVQLEVFLALVSINVLMFVDWYFCYLAWYVNVSRVMASTASALSFFVRLPFILVISAFCLLGLQLFLTLTFNALVIGPHVGMQTLARGFTLSKSFFLRGCAFLLLLDAFLILVCVALSPSGLYCLITRTDFFGANIAQFPIWVQIAVWLHYGLAFLVTIPLFGILNAYLYKDLSLRYEQQ